MSTFEQDIELPWQDHTSIGYWIEEQIWGHRILDSQTPWLIFLEMLGIADSMFLKGALLDERGKHYPLLFNPHRRMMLRNILYNNQLMPYILDKFPDDGRAWREWENWMHLNARGIDDRDFSYVPKRFSSFSEFARLTTMLQSATVESDTNRRWSSRFIFPFGETCLYEDVGVSAKGTLLRDYNNFGRTGELLYLMLCRSSSSEGLRPYLQGIVTNNNPWNTLVGWLQRGENDRAEPKGKSFLPYSNHRCYDLLGEDLLRVFDLRLPRFDSYPHIALLAALHVMLYQLTVAHDVTDSGRPTMVCEIVAPRKTEVRELSIQSYQLNSQISERAVSAFIESIVTSEEWLGAKSSNEAFSRCKEILLRRVAWPREASDYDGAHEPELLIRSLRQRAMLKHRQNGGNVHRTYGRSVGLISKRGTNKLRYAPTDALLKALILANVPDRMEFKEFLNIVFSRYGIVIGEKEAKTVMEDGDFDSKAFLANSVRLEQRLGSLGMVRRLSDACAYVLNPYVETSR